MRTINIRKLALLSPAGNTIDSLTKLLEGQTRINDAERLNPPGLGDEHQRRLLSVPDFEIESYVPKRGTKILDRQIHLGLAATVILRSGLGLGSSEDWRKTGIALGTTAGSVQSSAQFTEDLLRGHGIDLANPRVFPNSTMNSCASQIAIWQQMHGPNVTISSGVLGALVAAKSASRLLARGYATQMVVGAVEELSPHRAWARELDGGLRDSIAVGEAAGMFLLDDGLSTDTLAQIHGCEIGFTSRRTSEGYENALKEAVSRLPGDSFASDLIISCSVADQCVVAEENALSDFAIEQIWVRDFVGDCGAASSAVQIAAAIALGPPGGNVLLTGIDESGSVAAATIRIAQPAALRQEI